MGKGRGGRNHRGFPSKRPKFGSQVAPSTSASTSSARGDTDASSNTGKRNRKVPVAVHAVQQQTGYMVGDKPLSDFADDEIDEIILSKNAAPNRIKTPPIVVVRSSILELHTLTQNCVPSKNFTLRSMSVGIRVDVTDQAEHIAVKAALTTAGKHFYLYHSPTTKPLKYVLHGLPELEPKVIKTFLLERNITPEEVKMLNIKQKRFDEQAIYLLYFAPSSITLATLRKIKSINNVAVKFERYKPRTRNLAAQCRNCQIYGHSSVKCKMPSKCMVCAGDHKTDTCSKRIPRLVIKQKQQESKTPLDRSFIKCASCHGNHTSNYMGCPARKAFADAQSKTVRKRHVHDKPSVVRFEDHNFPPLGQASTNTYVPPILGPKQQNPSWTEVLQGIKTEQSSVVTLSNSLQSMMESMNIMINNMSQLVQALALQVAGTNSKQPT